MKLLNKVLWREGMHLSQHHFQAQSRYFEDTLQESVGQLFFAPFGVTSIAFDREALANGVVSLQHAAGIMPDGSPFNMPDGDDAPPLRSIAAEFPPGSSSQELLLALAPLDRGARSVTTPRKGVERYDPVKREIRDSVNGADTHAVEVGRKNLRVVLASEASEDDVKLPIARIARDGTGHFVYDASFIPPCIKLSGSVALETLVSLLLQTIDSKATAIADERDSSRQAVADFAAAEIANFWLLHTLRTHSASLRHYLDAREAHPERIYVELAKLSGALCTFTLDGQPDDVPAYEHINLTDCFVELAAQIRRRLGTVKPTGCVKIPLVKESSHLFVAPIRDERCLHPRSRWALGVRSSARSFAVVPRAPDVVKVCSRRFTMRLVDAQVAGLPLVPIAVPPSVLSPRADTSYFWVERIAQCGDDILKTKQIGVYIPDLIPDADVDLQVILPDET